MREISRNGEGGATTGHRITKVRLRSDRCFMKTSR